VSVVTVLGSTTPWQRDRNLARDTSSTSTIRIRPIAGPRFAPPLAGTYSTKPRLFVRAQPEHLLQANHANGCNNALEGGGLLEGECDPVVGRPDLCRCAGLDDRPGGDRRKRQSTPACANLLARSGIVVVGGHASVGEREAIDRLKDGDIGGLEELVLRHQVRAIRAAYLITGSRELAEDVVQSAFLRAYERIGQFDSNRPFSPWFLRSVANDAVKAAARARRSVPLEGDLVAASERALQRAEERQMVHDALVKLAPGQRAAVVLRYYLGLSEADIADRLACPQGTVKRRLHDARTRLRGLLAPARSHPKEVETDP
jgi:RNA polymerase sigma-70 factor (ECF subfamily)